MLFSARSLSCLSVARFTALMCGLAVLAGCSGAGTSNSPNAPVAAAGVTLSVPSVAFGTVGLGTSATSGIITVTNSGTAALAVSSVTGSGDFSAGMNTCTVSVPVGATCTLSVVFTPAAVGARTGTLTLTTNATGSPQTLPLTGTGGTSQVTVSATTLNYSAINLNATSPVQTLTLTSSGTAPLAISRIALTGDFAQTANTCTATLSTGATCSVSVTFMPTALGARVGAVTVSSNAGTQTVTLTGTGVAPNSYNGQPFTATILAGTQPIAGASVQLYAAGTTGNGSAGPGLLQTPLISGANGSVSFVTGYVCPSALGPVYLVATGGTVLGTSAANPKISLMTAIGSCNGIASGAKYTVNEATTVAAGYALTQFSGGGTAIGSTLSNQTGILNAFGTAVTLTDSVTGVSPGSALPATALSPAARINSVANMLNACTVSSAGCTALFAATPVTTTPATTLDAVLNLAKKPAANVAALYTQSLASTAFAPVLLFAPSDWTMFLTFSGGGLNSPSGLGIDSTGSVWVASYFYAASKFTPQGAAVFPNGVTGHGLNNSYGLAVDLNDQAWIPNEQPYTGFGIGSVTVLAPGGDYSPAGGLYANGGMNYPLSVAIDPNGTAWVVDYGNSHLTLLNSLGTPISGTDGYTTPLFAFPVSVAVDGNHFGWIANQSSTFVTKVSPDGATFVNYNCCQGASGIAIDQGNNVWVANFYGDSVSLISNTGAVISNGTYTGLGGIKRPQGIAIDGSGNVWVANYRQSYLTELTGSTSAAPGTSLSPATGFAADAQLLEAYALAIDASGNVWVSNQGNNTITKLIGMAVPVKTPLSGLPRLP